MFGAFMCDWAYVGTLDSNDVPAGKTAFLAGTMYTMHPTNIVARNWKIGALTRAKTGIDTGSRLARLSGTINCIAYNFYANEVTYAIAAFTAGDVGFEFAPVDVKQFACKGNAFINLRAETTNDGWCWRADSYADNVAAAAALGYVPLLDPLNSTDVVFRGIQGTGSGGASVEDGGRFDFIRGGTAIDCIATGYKCGGLFDESCIGTKILGGEYNFNRESGVKIHHATTPPTDCEVRGIEAANNGQSGSGHAGIWIESSLRAVAADNKRLGAEDPADETTQTYDIRVAATTAQDFTIEGNYMRSVDTGGVALSVLSSTDYNLAWLVRNNSCAAAITTKYGGLNIIPVARNMGADGIVRGDYIAATGALTAGRTPTAGTWIAGEKIAFTNAAAAASPGSQCTTGGTPGTFGLQAVMT
jgi:hypothetical protein